jgi:hypothetical protein
MNQQIDTVRPTLDRLQQRAFIVAIAGAVLLLVGAFISTEQFFRSYLIGFLLWGGVALGSLAIMMLHNLTGGPWGFAIRRILESGARTLPLVALLFVPLLFGIHSLYEWSHAEAVAQHHLIAHKTPYLNVTGFILRAVLYFALWIASALLVMRSLRRLEDANAYYVTPRLQSLSAAGLVIYFLMVTFASIDWVMSLEPEWYSTIYGMIFVIGQGLSTFAFAIAILVLLIGANQKLRDVVLPEYFHDLGNFLFAFTMLWAYVSFSQFLIVWSGNLPEEVTWYTHRIEGGWGVIPLVLLAVHFVMPFLLLLSRKVKRNGRILMRVAVLILVMRAVDLFWFVEPAFNPKGDNSFHMHWLDLVAPIALGGIWFYFFIMQLKKVGTLLPVNAPLLEEAHHE